MSEGGKIDQKCSLRHVLADFVCGTMYTGAVANQTDTWMAQ